VSTGSRPWRVVDLDYVSLYVEEFEKAVAFWTALFGPPEFKEQETTLGWKMGATYLTLFPAAHGTVPGSNPRNAEFAIRVEAPGQVDALLEAMVEQGAKVVMGAQDTWMYEKMRYGCVDDPFGVRIDVYCPAGAAS
jgi:catechol 2,3-dioxygenase-like lactoylglutathione lyase family enzyme